MVFRSLSALALGVVGSQAGCPWTFDWEWAGTFHLEDGSVTWNAEKASDGAYADASMKFLVLNVPATDHEALEAAETTATSTWSGNATSVTAGQPLSLGVLYELVFDQSKFVSQWTVSAAAGSNVAIFAQHIPTEFENRMHYFIAPDGHDVEPVEQESVANCVAHNDDHDDHKDKHGEVILAAFVTILPTLLGIFALVAAKFPQLLQNQGKIFEALNSGASGVVFAAALFLLLPEATFLTEKSWHWALSTLMGWFLGVLIDHLCAFTPAKFDTPVAANQAVEDAEKGSADATTVRSKWSIAGPVLLGDAFHNLTDGFVLGLAFRSCTSSLGWKIAGVTILHEVPQELADFIVLIGHAGMSWQWATLANFISGLTTIFGALIVYSVETSAAVEGNLLAMGAGVYIYVALTELGPKIAHLTKTSDSTVKSLLTSSLLRLACFSLGATMIGLVLLDHEHCAPPVAPGEVDPHAGHNH